jgi:HEAT repeat protein
MRPSGRALDDARFIDARERALDKLRRVYADDGEDPGLRGAFALGLGIAADAKAGSLLAAAVAQKKGSPEFASYSCAALGLLGDVPAASLAVLRQALADRSSDVLRLEAARALGLLGDAKAIPALVEELDRGGSDTVLARAVVALGAIRDASAIAPLAALARKPGAPDATHALACAGLGLLADAEEIRSLSLLGIDSNYLAGTDSLDEALSML